MMRRERVGSGKVAVSAAEKEGEASEGEEEAEEGGK